MSPHLLLDIDGVLIRDYVLLDHVKSNIVRYVSKKLPGMKRHEKINNLLYKAYGHTGIGIKEEFGLDTRDFDEFVYNRYLIAHLYDHIQNDEKFKQDALTLQRICDFTSVSFFSNAPLNWTEPIREAIDLRIKNTSGNLKPKLESYLKFSSDKKFVFVDDKIGNLVPTAMLGNWTPIQYSEKGSGDSQQIKVIHDISEVWHYL